MLAVVPQISPPLFTAHKHTARDIQRHFFFSVSSWLEFPAPILSWSGDTIWISVISSMLSTWQQKRIGVCFNWKLPECQLKQQPVHDGIGTMQSVLDMMAHPRAAEVGCHLFGGWDGGVTSSLVVRMMGKLEWTTDGSDSLLVNRHHLDFSDI